MTIRLDGDIGIVQEHNIEAAEMERTNGLGEAEALPIMDVVGPKG